MSRITDKKLAEKGRKSYGTYYSTPYRQKDTDMYFISQDGDRCDNLAFRFYGNSSFWWIIAKVNHLKTMR